MSASSWRRRVAVVGLVALTAAMAGPWIASNPPTMQFADRTYAPPMRVRVLHDGALRAPFVYPQRLVNRVSREYVEDRSAPVTLRWFSGGLVSIPAEHGPLLLLGADPLGRDTLSRLLHGAPWSLGVALAGLAGALLIGILVGGAAGAFGGRLDSALMWSADFVLALPGAYLVLVLRGLLPNVLASWQIFALLSLLFAVSAWPHVARGVRAIVATERQLDYAEAARASGAGPWRLAWSLLPAARGFLVVETVLLLPALLIAEATISFLGLGFPETSASWGTLLAGTADSTVLLEAPWMLAPAAAIFLVTLAAQLSHRSPARATERGATPLAPASL